MKGIKSTLKEKIAILRLKQGDSEAFGYLYDIYIDRIYRFVYFKVSDTSTAYDITQEVFLDVWENIINNKEIGKLRSFIYKIAYHKVVDYYRSKHRQALLIEDVDQSKIQSTGTDTTTIEMHLLKNHLSQLKQEYQDVIILKHIEGLSINEIANIVSKDSNNVRVLLHRALTALKELYQN